ncbi:hypothetical protein X975_05949, partial [Stegodyphus mimosarum]
MGVTDKSTFVIHSPSIPMTLKDMNITMTETGHIPVLPTLDPGHEAILEMHANSEASALFYVVIVLVLYVLALVAVLTKYLRTEHYENRLTRLYEEFVRRDRYMNRVSKRNTLPPPPIPVNTKVKKNKQSLVVRMIEPECNV